MSKYPYIVAPYSAALAAALITEPTTRRTNHDKSKVILTVQDFETYSPVIEAEGGELRCALTLEEKTENIGAVIFSHADILSEINTPEWRSAQIEGEVSR